MEDSIQDAVSQLTNIYPDVIQISSSEFQISFILQFGKFYIRIRFPKTFPNSAPHILSAVIAEHPLIDMFSIINYPEYSNWSPKSNLCDILLSIQSEFAKNPPVPTLERKFPDFSELCRTHPKPIKKDEDLSEIIQRTEEFKNFSSEKDKILAENKELAKRVIELKKKYNNKLSENNGKIEEYLRAKDRLIYTQKKAEEIQKELAEKIVPRRLMEINNESVTSAGGILMDFMQKRVRINEFVEEYKERVKISKMINIVKKGKDNKSR